MKSINFWETRKILLLLIVVICGCNLVFSIKIKKQSDFKIEIMNSTTALRDPIIDPNRKIKGPESNLEKVTYVKEISQGGKEALKRVEQGE
jgi:hypothetical protein